MRDNMYEGLWSPFDPSWYQQAFDKFISTADELFNQNEIIKAGYTLPDSDGSRSSVFHQNAVTNNSFDETVLRDTLSDIYMNSYHRLTAANHDNVHFYQWYGTMKDVRFVSNTQLCEIRIPTEGFLDPSSRDKYKLRQFFRKWIPLTELLNNWDTFKFTVLLFINHRIYSDYEIRIDDQETVIRFRYFEHWRSNKYRNTETGDIETYTDEEYNELPQSTKDVLQSLSYPIYIYKFDTTAQCRVKVSKELITNRWNWKMPMSYIGEERNANRIDTGMRKHYTCPTCDKEYRLTNGASIFTNHVMVAFNRISDLDIRTDGNTIVDVLGDNIEFLKIEDGYIDLDKCSAYNKHLLVTDEDQWIWMTIVVPKFMHEFPIVLPTDVLYRPHVAAYEPVMVKNNGIWLNTKATVPSFDDPLFNVQKDVYVDTNNPDDTSVNFYLDDEGHLILVYDGGEEITDKDIFVDDEGYLILMSEGSPTDNAISGYHFDKTTNNDLLLSYTWDDGWEYTIRPIVLSDAFDVQNSDIYDSISEEMIKLKMLTANGAKTVEAFRYFIDNASNNPTQYTTEDFEDNFETLQDALQAIHDEYISYLESRQIDPDESYLSIWEEYGIVCNDILAQEDKFWAISRFHQQHTKYNDFYGFISPLIYIPDEFTYTYNVATILKQIGDTVLWEDVDKFKSQLRFQRPVDASDFWTFEYDRDACCWRPVHMNVDHRFPDVYLLSDPNEKSPTPNRIFKSFLFYSDTINPREISTSIARPTPSWDKDLQEYEMNMDGKYRSLYIEKFYWAGVKTIYPGLLATKYRWECIEYIKNNPNYERFNLLFLNTMDPYIKMGEATYLKSDNYGFLVDDKIAKMNEYLKAHFLGYNRITGFEMYLNKHWKPSYFDATKQVDDTFDAEPRHIRRPRSTFDTRRVIRVLQNCQSHILEAIVDLRQEIDSIRQEIEQYQIIFQIELLTQLDEYTAELENNISDCIEFVNELDLDIFSNDDVRTIISYLRKHFSLINKIKTIFKTIENYIGDINRFDIKLEKLRSISEIIRIALHDIVYTLGSYIQTFDIESFMKGVNNYEFFNEYDHRYDDCLIGTINQFNTAWPQAVQDARDKLYVSTTALWAFFDPTKSYAQSDVGKMLQMIYTVRDDIEALHTEVFKCWDSEEEYDANIVSKFRFARDSIAQLIDSMEHIIELRTQLFNTFDDIRALIVEVTALGIDDREEEYALDIDSAFDEILYHLSYIAGENRKADALAVYNRTVQDIEEWIAYIERTKSIFAHLLTVVGEPNAFLEVLAPYHEYLEALIDYMETAIIDFIPDTDTPTYASVYAIDTIGLVNGGFDHAVGDMVYFDNMGVYRISEVEGRINTATALEDPNDDAIDLAYEFNLNSYGELELEVPDTPESGAYLSDDDHVIVTLDDDSDSEIQNYALTVAPPDETLYLNHPNSIGVELTEDDELIITVDTDEDFDLYMDENGELILVTGDDVNLDIEMYRFYVTSSNDLMLRRIDQIFYRNTVFRDPTWQTNPYDSTTSGIGMGITANALTSTETKIIDDSVIPPFKERVSNLLTMITIDMYSINPYANREAIRLLNIASRIKTDWDDLAGFYSDNMSPEMITAMTRMTNSLALLISPIDQLIRYREQNNLQLLIGTFSAFMDLCDTTFKEKGLYNASYIYFSNKVREKLTLLMDYYGNGTDWDDASELLDILDQCLSILDVFYRQMIRRVPELTGEYNILIDEIHHIQDITTNIDSTHTAIRIAVNEVSVMNSLIPDPIRIDKWYRFSRITVAVEGSGYQIGDIVEIVPALSTDIYGNPIHDDEAEVMSDRLYLKITQVSSEGGVITVKPIMDYALPYMMNGVRDTITKSGNGDGMKIMVVTAQITQKDCRLFWTDDSYIPPAPQYNDSDLFMFKFSNIHDLPIGYDVFMHGRQMTNVIIRHQHEEDQYKPRDIDIIYLNANDVMALANSSVFIEAQKYFIYKLKQIAITDSGAGYYKGQIIRLGTDQVVLKLKVTELTDDNVKGIANVEMVQNYQLFNGVNPTDDEAIVIADSMNNIDDEYNSGYYDSLPTDGIVKPAAPPYPATEYPFISKRFDDSEPDRNRTWMHPDVDFPEGYEDVMNGDPDDYTYLGTREENSILGITSDRWNGISEVVPVTDPFIPDIDRIPGSDLRGEYQLIQTLKIHSGSPIVPADRIVSTHADLPTHTEEWDDVNIGDTVIVSIDETMDDHRTLYRVRTFLVSGYIIYDEPIPVDTEWTSFNIKWKDINCFQDLPDRMQQYSSANWYNGDYGDIVRDIAMGKIKRDLLPVATLGTYIHNASIDDISVYNFTLKCWEDLYDQYRWYFHKTEDGFTLEYSEPGNYAYNMMLFLNKSAVNQMRNEQLKRNATFNVLAEIYDDVNTKSRNISVLTGRQLRFRKLFPYEQKEEYTLPNTTNNHELRFKLAPYMHYKNEIHLQDITLALISGDNLIQFEDITDTSRYEVRIKDDKAKSRGYETQTKTTVRAYVDCGSGFSNGDAWAWNAEHQIHIFGHIEANMTGEGELLKFIPEHTVNAPTDPFITLEFKVYQNYTSADPAVASILVDFTTERVQVYGDGWLHNVTNPYAPIKDEFMIVIKYDYPSSIQYQISINKNPDVWCFIRDKMELFPIFTIPNSHIPENRLYLATDIGRLPLINPSTGKPSIRVMYTETDTLVQYLNIYHKYERMEVHVNPYPMRSVYTRRRISADGYIDLAGRLNKPLNKKYFEFWMNGRLLDDEVTIISPTKIFLHGLISLRNFEIVEINRDPNEFFSDPFLSSITVSGIPRPVWNYQTYLDDALEANAEYGNYTIAEQKALLSPAWPQVDYDDAEYPIYPNNTDEEDDILMRIDTSLDISELPEAPVYQFTVIDVPSIEGVPVFSRTMTFEQMGFKPISEEEIIAMINEEWAEEIEAGMIPQPTIISEDDWYGMAVRMYNEEGHPVIDVDEAAYKVTVDQILSVNAESKISRIIPTHVEYDLT